MAVTPLINWLAIWDDFEADGGAPVDLLPGNVVNDLSSAIHFQEVNGDDRLNIVVPRSSVSWNSGGLQERKVLRLEMTDGTVEEYRIVLLNETRERDGKLTGTIEAEGAVFELSGLKKIQRDESSGLTQPDFGILNLTPTQLIDTYILPFAPAYFARGTIDPTDEVPEFTFDFWNPLEALRNLAELTNTELEITRPSGSAYNINLRTTVGAGSAKPFVTLGKNLTRFVKKTDTKKTANRIYGKGAGDPGNRLTLGGNLWEITSNSPLTLAGAPVWEDDALIGLYVGNEDGTGLQEITDSTNPGVFVVGTPGSFTVGERARIFQDSAGTHVSYLEDVASVAARKAIPGNLEAPDLAQADNFAPNSKLDGFVGDNPDDWAAINGATLTENIDANFTRIGGKSLKVVAAASGEGVDCDPVAITPPVDNPYYSGLISIWVVSGAVRFELEHSVEGVFPPPEKKAWTQATGDWVDITISGLLLTAGTLKINVIADGGAATWYLDGALMANAAKAPGFVAEHSANELWRRSAVELVKRRTPDVSYQVGLIDLNAIDPTTYPFDKLVLGGDVRVVDPDLASDVDLRVISWRRDKIKGFTTSTVLANRVRTLTDEQLSRKLRGLDPAPDNTSASFLWLDHSLDVSGDLVIKYRLNEFGKSIRYATSNSAQPTRATAVAGTIQDSDNEEGLTLAAALAPNLGDVAYATIVAFTGASGTGRDGLLIEIRVTQGGDSNVIVTAYLTPIPFTDEGAGNPGINETILPDSDIETVDWRQGTGSPATALWDELNDGSDSTFGESSISNAVCAATDVYDFEVGFANPSVTPEDSQTQTIKLRAKVASSDISGNLQTDVVLELKQSTTVIATSGDLSFSGGFAFVEYELTNAQLDLITDHTLLRMRVEVTICDPNGVFDEFAQCSQLEIQYIAKATPPVTGNKVDLVYDVKSAVDELDIVVFWDDGTGPTSHSYTKPTIGGVAGVERIQGPTGDFHYRDTWTDFSLNVTPVAQPGDNNGRLVQLDLEDQAESGAGTSAKTTAGPVATAEFLVPGTNVTVTTDAFGRPQINAVIGASGLGGLTDVTLTAEGTGEILQKSAGDWINRTLAEAGISATGHTHAAADITSGTLLTARGGTGVSSPTSGNLLVGAGSSAMTALAPGSAGGFVRSSGSAWVRNTIQASDLPTHTHPASEVTAGTFTGAFVFATALPTSNTVAKIASITSGTGISVTGGDNPTVSLQFSSLVASGTPVSGDHFVWQDGANSRRILIQNVPLSVMSNDSGWTTNTGTVTSVGSGTGLSGGPVTGSGTIDLNLFQLTASGTLIGTDDLATIDGTLSRKTQINTIPLGIFSNDQGWTSTLGTVTTVTAGAGLTGGGTPTPTLNVIGTTNRILVNANNVDIHGSYVGQTSITTLGTITTGTIPAARVGAGTLAGNFTFSSRTRFITGSAAAPSLVGPTVLDTGIYFPTATALGVSVEGVVRMLFQRTGVSGDAGWIEIRNSQFGNLLLAADIGSAVDWDKGNVQTLDNDTGTTSITMTAGRPGFTYVLIVDPGTGASASLTWPVGIKWLSGAAPGLSTTTSHFDIVYLICIATDTYMGSYTLAHQ